MIEVIDAVTLFTRDMARAVRFYTKLGFRVSYGGETEPFTTFAMGSGYLNLQLQEDYPGGRWGRVIFHVPDVDAVYACALAGGLTPTTTPRDAEWGERYFHISDPDGHELSFAKRLA